MNSTDVKKILADTAYVRTSGTAEELNCARYLVSVCAQMGLSARIEAFPVTMYDVKYAHLTVDGRDIPCKAYWGCANGTAEAKLYYLRGTSSVALKKCRDKIVLVDNALTQELYELLTKHNARAIITCSGNACFGNRDIDQKELRFEICEENRVPIVNIHICDGLALAGADGKLARIAVQHSAYPGSSHNVILDIDGQTEQTLVISAHYDSTAFSHGAYDNMSGCIGLLYLAEFFAARPNRRRIRLLWCGSEERGLLGSLAYCRANPEGYKNTVLNINLDMLGSVMGDFVAFSCANEEMKDLLTSFLAKHRFPASVRHAIRSSDSNSFVYYGIPAVSFARYAPSHAVPIHTRFDTAEALSPKVLLQDMKIISAFADYIANTPDFPIPISISEHIKEEVKAYMDRKPLSVRGKGV